MNLSLKNVRKSYKLPDGTVRTVISIDALEVSSGTHAAVFGDSGSGKSTFLNLISGLVPVSQGEIMFGDQALNLLSESGRDAFRARHIGFVFQNFYLFQGYNALENVMMGALFSGRKIQTEKARHLLETVGLGDRIYEIPSRLSTGQRQRVALARALAHDPEIILADEPTGNLDPANRDAIMDLLFSVAKNRTLIVVTHDESVKKRFLRQISLPVENGAPA